MNPRNEMRRSRTRGGRQRTGWRAARIFLLAAFLASCRESGPRATVFTRAQKQVVLAVEVANTEDARKHALGSLAELGPDRGVVLHFDREDRHPIELPYDADVLFLAPMRVIVDVAKSGQGMAEAKAPFVAALVVQAGFAERHGVAIGDKVEVPEAGAPKSHSRP